MARFTWSLTKRLRPDPYEDWRKQIAGQPLAQDIEDNARSGDFQGVALNPGWVPVTIELLVNPGDPVDSALRHLDWVLDRLDDKTTDAPEIRAAQRQRQKLGEIRNDIDRDGDAAAVLKRLIVFKAYMREDSVFKDGEIKHYKEIRFRFTAPTIPTSNKPGPDFLDVLRNKGRTGQTVIIGIIDDGLAFANSRFCTRTSGGSPYQTRFEALWLQDVETIRTAGDDVGVGRVLRKADIDKLLTEEFDAKRHVTNERAIYRRAGITPDREEHMTVHRAASHGCHVLDLAAGEDPDYARVDRPIIGVQLPTVVTAETSGRTLTHYAVEALDFILHEADILGRGSKLPVVINFSYGFEAGAKIGTSAFEMEIDRLIAARNDEAPTVVVLPAGNAHHDGTNAVFELGSGGEETLEWIVSPDDRTESFAEIHLRSQNSSPSVEISIAPPGGKPAIALSGPGKHPMVLADGSAKVAALYLDGPGHLKDRNRMRAIAAVNRTNARDTTLKAAPSGRWTVTLRNTGGTPLLVHAMIQRDDTLTGYRVGGRQSVWDHDTAHRRSPKTGDYKHTPDDAPLTGRGTLSALSGGEFALVVGAADDGAYVPAEHGAGAADTGAREPTPSPYSSAGLCHLLSDMRPWPHMSVPVDQGPLLTGMFASGTMSGSLVPMNGTSVAAPLMVRTLADFLSRRGPLNGPVTASPGATVFASILSGPCAFAGSSASVNHGRLGAFTLPRSDGGHWQNNARLKRSRT